jgi:hypothetical protein
MDAFERCGQVRSAMAMAMAMAWLFTFTLEIPDKTLLPESMFLCL